MENKIKKENNQPVLLTNKELLDVLDKIQNGEAVDEDLFNLTIDTLKEMIVYKRPQSRWVKQNDYHYCERCMELAPNFDGEEELSDYCLVCGAEMIEVVD